MKNKPNPNFLIRRERLFQDTFDRIVSQSDLSTHDKLQRLRKLEGRLEGRTIARSATTGQFLGWKMPFSKK